MYLSRVCVEVDGLVPEQRSRRGPHPGDQELFGTEAVAQLRPACGDLAWLLNHGYAPGSSLKLVGDRYRLKQRQRIAVSRVCCSDRAAEGRRRSQLDIKQVVGQELWLDGFNVLVTLEAALGGGVVLKGRDGCLRDMSSMHGTYRKTSDSAEALRLLGQVVGKLGVARCCWYFDSPVSNSGRVVELVRGIAAENDWPWEAQTTADPDQLLSHCEAPIVTADSAVLDRAARWFNLTRQVVESCIPAAWIIDFANGAE